MRDTGTVITNSGKLVRTLPKRICKGPAPASEGFAQDDLLLILRQEGLLLSPQDPPAEKKVQCRVTRYNLKPNSAPDSTC